MSLADTPSWIADVLKITTPQQAVTVGITALVVALARGQITAALEGASTFRHRDARDLKALLETKDLLDPDAKEIFQDQHEARLLERFTGIYAERATRTALSVVIRRSGGEYDWRAVRRAWVYLKVVDGQVQLREPERKGKRSALFNRIFGWVLFIMFALAFSITFLSLLLRRPGEAAVYAVYGVLMLLLSISPWRDAHNYTVAAALSKLAAKRSDV